MWGHSLSGSSSFPAAMLSLLSFNEISAFLTTIDVFPLLLEKGAVFVVHRVAAVMLTKLWSFHKY